MQNTKPPPPSLASPIPVLDRVIAIAPAPLLPGEKETDYTAIAVRIVRASGPRDAIEEFLIRDMIDLTWEILRIRRVKAGILRASVADGVSKVLAGVGHPYQPAQVDRKQFRVIKMVLGGFRARTLPTKAGSTNNRVINCLRLFRTRVRSTWASAIRRAHSAVSASA